MAVELLSDEFVASYPDKPTHMTPIGEFTYLRTYSRYLPNEPVEVEDTSKPFTQRVRKLIRKQPLTVTKYGRREKWKETVRRAVEYNVGLEYRYRAENGLVPIDIKKLRKEAEFLYDNMFNLRQFLSGRTLWVGGAETGVAEKFPLANFNCSFTAIKKWDDLAELFYLLLVGTGVGFRCSKEMARNLPPIRNNVRIKHLPYKPKKPEKRLEQTKVTIYDKEKVQIHVGDSKEGWVDALNHFFHILTDTQFEDIRTIVFCYNSVRPRGERLKTFGGTASGPEPLREMFEGIEKVLKNQIEEGAEPPEEVGGGYVRVRPIHILDIGNLIGYNVVVGGVRRTAEIFLCDEDDWECIFAKYGINGLWGEDAVKRHKQLKALMLKLDIPVPYWWDKLNFDDPNTRPLHHRRMSNNSIVFKSKPSVEFLKFLFELLRGEGEPNFINLREAARRRLKGKGIHHPTQEQLELEMLIIGMNPCAEILLQSKGVCNLTTVNVMQFVDMEKRTLKLDKLIDAQKLSARCGLRMTLVDLELDRWDKVQKQDRLLGCSLTGWKDAVGFLGMSKEEEASIENLLKEVARKEANRYADELGVNRPLLVTTVKPEGTLSLVAGAVSPGLHMAHSPYYIRRIRINAEDPLAKACLEHKGWVINPEVGTPGETREEKLKNARTLVIDFPVKSGATRTKDDISVKEQFETYLSFQAYYTEHNSSNTITVKPHEWEDACQLVFDNWDNFVGVSFLPYDGGTYDLAPYEAISEEEYNKLKEQMEPFDFNKLLKYEIPQDTELDETLSDCATGACPVR